MKAQRQKTVSVIIPGTDIHYLMTVAKMQERTLSQQIRMALTEWRQAREREALKVAE
jgi:hypothetical protein